MVLILSELFSLSIRGISSEDCGSTLLDIDIHAKIKSYNPPQLLYLAVTGWCSDPVMIPLIPYSKGFVRVPHQVRKVASPMVSKALATAEIPTVSRARFSWNTWTMNWSDNMLAGGHTREMVRAGRGELTVGAEVARKIRPPR